MYGRMFDGLAGCFAVLVVLAVAGLVALGALAWWVFSNISFTWGAA